MQWLSTHQHVYKQPIIMSQQGRHQHRTINIIMVTSPGKQASCIIMERRAQLQVYSLVIDYQSTHHSKISTRGGFTYGECPIFIVEWEGDTQPWCCVVFTRLCRRYISDKIYICCFSPSRPSATAVVLVTATMTQFPICSASLKLARSSPPPLAFHAVAHALGMGAKTYAGAGRRGG